MHVLRGFNLGNSEFLGTISYNYSGLPIDFIVFQKVSQKSKKYNSAPPKLDFQNVIFKVIFDVIFPQIVAFFGGLKTFEKVFLFPQLLSIFKNRGIFFIGTFCLSSLDWSLHSKIELFVRFEGGVFGL